MRWYISLCSLADIGMNGVTVINIWCKREKHQYDNNPARASSLSYIFRMVDTCKLRLRLSWCNWDNIRFVGITSRMIRFRVAPNFCLFALSISTRRACVKCKFKAIIFVNNKERIRSLFSSFHRALVDHPRNTGVPRNIVW